MGWMSVAVSMAIGASAVAGVPSALARVAWVAGQTAPRPSQVHAALNSGIDCYRRADYQTAARYFQQAQEGQVELSAEEKQELTRLVRLNTAALKARQGGGDQIPQAEEAVTAGRNADAAAILKALETNQFLAASDKGKAQLLTDQLRDGAPVVRGQSDQDARFTHPLLLGCGKLQQARQLMAK